MHHVLNTASKRLQTKFFLGSLESIFSFVLLVISRHGNGISKGDIQRKIMWDFHRVVLLFFGCGMGNSRKKNKSKDIKEIAYPPLAFGWVRVTVSVKPFLHDESSIMKRWLRKCNGIELIIWSFQGSWRFLAFKFPRDLTQFCGISRGGALFCLEFSRGI